jgi:hypothetical protein
MAADKTVVNIALNFFMFDFLPYSIVFVFLYSVGQIALTARYLISPAHASDSPAAQKRDDFAINL